jgi:hypothetical protein
MVLGGATLIPACQRIHDAFLLGISILAEINSVMAND